MTKPDWCPQWAWDTAERHLRPDQFGIMQPAQVLLARVAIEAERRAEERNAEAIRRLQDNMSKMAMDWTKAMARERQAGIAKGMERAAEIAEKHASPGQMWERDEMPTAKLATGYAAQNIAAAIRAAAREIEP